MIAIDVIQLFYRHAGQGSFAAAIDLFAENGEIVFHGPDSIPLSGSYRGKTEIGRFFEIVGSTLDVRQFEPMEFIATDSHVVVLGRECSQVKANGNVFDVRWVQVWNVSMDGIQRLEDFFDTGSMAAAFAALPHQPTRSGA